MIKKSIQASLPETLSTIVIAQIVEGNTTPEHHSVKLLLKYMCIKVIGYRDLFNLGCTDLKYCCGKDFMFLLNEHLDLGYF